MTPKHTANPIEARCRTKGVRLTGQRRAVAEVLAKAHDHPDTYELHRRVARTHPKISLATVYRTVRRFEAEGILERHEFRNSRARYETTARKHHDHLIDLETGNVIEFSSPEIERLQEEIASRLGYRLAGHRLELYALPLRAGARKRRP